MEIIDKHAKRLNPTQKNIAAVVFTVIMLVLTMPLANSVDGYAYGNHAFDFEDTWWVWLISVGLIGYVLNRIYASANSSQ